MGGLRLLLAFMVAQSHTGMLFMGYQTGVVAVVSFFMISGYVMALLVQRHYASLDRIPAFYADRIARLFPQFLLWSAATLLFLRTTGYSSPFVDGCDARGIALNFLMLPNGYATLFGARDCMLLPQSWSLGLELTFYLAAPFLVLAGRAVRIAAAASGAVFLAAYCGAIDTRLYGYTLLPGTLFIFMAGFWFAPRNGTGRFYAPLVWLFAAALFWAAQRDPAILAREYNKEVLLGLLIGIPALAAVRRLRQSAADALLGDLSYGVFLNHMLCMWALHHFLGMRFQRLDEWLVLFAGCTALAFASHHLVERPVLRWRRGWRVGAGPPHGRIALADGAPLGVAASGP